MWLILPESGELVAIRPGGIQFCPWGREQPKWAGLGCSPGKASANLLCAAQEPRGQASRGRPTGQSGLQAPAGSCLDLNNEPHTRHLVAAGGADLSVTAFSIFTVPRTPL